MPKKTPPNHRATLRAFWKPRGKVHAENAQTLRAWLKAHAAGIDIATFIHHEKNAPLHSKVIAALINK